MRTIVVISLWIVFCSIAHAYERPNAVSLGGQWEFCPVAPMIDIVPDRYVRPDFPQLSPTWDEVIDPQAVPPVDAQWMDVIVPMAWENYTHPGYNEAGWYRRTIEVLPWLPGMPKDTPDPRHFWLEFDAVATVAGVWVDGKFVGGHVGDYSRWRVEITDFAKSKPEVELLVYVDELPGHITQGFLSMIAPHHGGIWQDVRLYTTGFNSIEPDGVSIEYDPETELLQATILLSEPWDEQRDSLQFNAKRELPLMGCSIFDPSFFYTEEVQVLDGKGNQVVAYVHVPEDLYRSVWSPDIPTRWHSGVGIWSDGAGDRVVQGFAIRKIEMDGSKVLLNGEQIKIRSVLNWGYYPGVYGPAPSPETVRKEFAYIKSLGFNAETVCLINMPDYFYDIADEMGVLIWQEYPTWHNDFDAKHLATYRSEFPAYLRRDRNHPSIIMRSLSVEAGVADWDVIDELYSLTKEMTDTPVQDNNSWFSHSRPEYTDWYGEDNYFNNAQWARHLLERLPEQLDEYPEKPYIVGESILFNTWPDIDALDDSLGRGGALSPPENGVAETPPNQNEEGGDSAPPLPVKSQEVVHKGTYEMLRL